MKTKSKLAIILVVLSIQVSAGASLIVQGGADSFVAFEAETFVASGGFVLVDRIDQYTTTGGSSVLPAGTTASGGAVLVDSLGNTAWDGPNGNSGQTIYHLQFANPGDYYLYIRYSNLERNGDASYGNEDSIHIPVAFNTPAASSGGEQDLGNSFFSATAEAKDFIWRRANGRSGAGANAVENIQYSVLAPQVGSLLTFQIDDREAGTVLDRFVFSTNGALTATDLNALANSFVAVPEPSSVLLLGLFLSAFGLNRRARRTVPVSG